MAHLIGKLIIKGDIEVKTGMRIGGTTTGLKIGGVDLNVITDPLGKPYIPGSSLKGKLRTLLERKEKVEWNKKDKQGNPIGHECDTEEKYQKCAVCKIFGILGSQKISSPTLTRLIVRDAYLDESSITEEMKKNLELEWTEVKFETAINRITGTALGGSLRQAERVPAGACFKECELIFSIYDEKDIDLVKKVFEAIDLLNDDYLGGMGSRGYGKVEFKDIKVFWNKAQDYENGTTELKEERKINGNWTTPAEIVKNFEEIKKNLT
ncbi:MAG: type III-A CRISPR-associated RAMP protein Csm3 [candidate division WOR-3 bacterium]|nr:type III-A CRISPR-associated RAMP protein Csm3 [candidate division WOR-3 bacterium]